MWFNVEYNHMNNLSEDKKKSTYTICPEIELKEKEGIKLMNLFVSRM